MTGDEPRKLTPAEIEHAVKVLFETPPPPKTELTQEERTLVLDRVDQHSPFGPDRSVKLDFAVDDGSPIVIFSIYGETFILDINEFDRAHGFIHSRIAEAKALKPRKADWMYGGDSA